MEKVTIKKLREELQNSRGAELLNPNRVISIFITYFVVIRTKIAAVQITFFSLLLAFIGTFLISLKGNFFPLLGVSLFYLYAILDSVDGEVARYRKTASIYGAYVDAITHPITRPLTFIAVSYWLFRFYDNNYWFLILGTYLTYIIHFSQLLVLEREEKISKLKREQKEDRVRGYRVIMNRLGFRTNESKFIKFIIWLAAYIMQEWGAVILLLISALFDFVLLDVFHVKLLHPFKLYFVIFYTISFSILYFIDYVLSYKFVMNSERESKKRVLT